MFLIQLTVKTLVEVNFNYSRNVKKKCSFIVYDLFISPPVKFPVLGLTGFSLDAIDRHGGASVKFKGTDCGGGKSVRKGREVEEEVIQRDGSDGWTAVCRGTGRLLSLGSIPRRWAEPSVPCVLPLPGSM